MGEFTSKVSGSKGSGVDYENALNIQTSAYSPLKQIISLSVELDQSRKLVERKEQELEQAKQNMANATQKVQTGLESLDPSTRDLIRAMLGQIDEKTDSLTDDDTKGMFR